MSRSHVTRNHDYINIDELGGIPGFPPSVTRKESSSSNSTTDGANKKEGTVNLSKKDSFYESDENLSFVSPAKTQLSESKPAMKEKPALKQKPSADKFKPVPLPRKQDSQISNVTSYENEEAIQNFKAQELAQQLAQELANQDPSKSMTDQHEEFDIETEIRAETSTNLKADSTVERSFTDVKQDEVNSSPEIFEYENNSLGPLPSYEEAISGDAEFFNMDELEGPPVPVRGDSQQVVMATPPDVSAKVVRYECNQGLLFTEIYFYHLFA